MNVELRQSQHLHVIERPAQSHIVYHKLFGNLSFLNDSALAMLRAFAEPVPVNAAMAMGDAVRSFHDLYFLVSDDDDERAELTADLARRARELESGAYLGGVQLCVSEACNFKCSYCFCDAADVRSARRTELSRSGQKLMTIDTAVRVIDTLIAHVKHTGRNALSVKFFGREPLINWRVIHEVMHHYGNGSAAGIALRYSITTNGSLVSDGIAEELAAFGVHTTVSIDSSESDDSATRFTMGGAPTFRLARRGIDILAAHDRLDVLSMVLTASNFDTFDDSVIDLTAACGARELQLLLGMQGDFIRGLEPQALIDKLAGIWLRGRERGVAVTGYWYNSLPMLFHTRKVRADDRIQRGVTNSCSATGYQVSIEPSGDIFPCRATATHLGHIDSLEDLLHSDVYRRLVMRTYNNVPDCNGCEIEGFCQGECPGNSEKKTGDIYAIDFSYCDIYRGAHRRLLQLH